MSGDPSPFFVKDCTLAMISTGAKAQTLAELCECIARAPQSSIFYHFWEGRLCTRHFEPEYHNDFANWIHRYLHDDVLAERLDLLNPSEFKDIEGLRQELLELIGNRMEELDTIIWTPRETRFDFIRSKIVIFSTPYCLDSPEALMEAIPRMTHSSIFFHVIDATRRSSEGKDDFSVWLEQFGKTQKPLITDLQRIDPYFISLPMLQEKIASTLQRHLTH